MPIVVEQSGRHGQRQRARHQVLQHRQPQRIMPPRQVPDQQHVDGPHQRAAELQPVAGRDGGVGLHAQQVHAGRGDGDGGARDGHGDTCTHRVAGDSNLGLGRHDRQRERAVRLRTHRPDVAQRMVGGHLAKQVGVVHHRAKKIDTVYQGLARWNTHHGRIVRGVQANQHIVPFNDFQLSQSPRQHRSPHLGTTTAAAHGLRLPSKPCTASMPCCAPRCRWSRR